MTAGRAGRVSGSRRPRDVAVTRRVRITALLFLFPAALFILFSYVVPVVWNVILSFQSWDGFISREWVGIANYLNVVRDGGAIGSFYNSAFLAVVSTAVAVVVGFLLAILIYNVGRREGSVYRLVLFTPVMLPLSIIGLLFAFIFSPQLGPLNQFLRLIGLDALALAWLGNPKSVMWAVSFVESWRMSGLTMMLCYAALQSIPNSILEAATIDGANYFGRLAVILPLVRPIVQVAAVYTLITSFKTYDLVFVMTRGGPGTCSVVTPLYMLRRAFYFNQFGYTASIGVVYTVLILAILVLVRRILKSEYYEL
jgi:ABC-type sugar transport system permease subunit